MQDDTLVYDEPEERQQYRGKWQGTLTGDHSYARSSSSTFASSSSPSSTLPTHSRRPRSPGTYVALPNLNPQRNPSQASAPLRPPSPPPDPSQFSDAAGTTQSCYEDPCCYGNLNVTTISSRKVHTSEFKDICSNNSLIYGLKAKTSTTIRVYHAVSSGQGACPTTSPLPNNHLPGSTITSSVPQPISPSIGSDVAMLHVVLQTLLVAVMLAVQRGSGQLRCHASFCKSRQP